MNHLRLKGYITLIVVSVLLVSTACSSSSNTNQQSSQNTSQTTTSTDQASSDTASTQDLSLTLDELKQYDGQNGNAAYVAVDGVIYDVTHVRKWKNGKHEMGITAGQDLTELISQSPHGKSILSEAPVVGKIK